MRTWRLTERPNDVVQTRTEARFYLLFADPPGGFDLMAECALCGALTETPLMLAWEERRVECSNCGVAMRLDDGRRARRVHGRQPTPRAPAHSPTRPGRLTGGIRRSM